MLNHAVSRRSFLKKVAGGAAVMSTLPMGFRAWGQDEITAGYVFLTTPGDAGWTFRHDLGRQFAEDNIEGVSVNSLTVEGVADADAGTAVQNLVSAGSQIVFATSFGFLSGAQEVASANPDLFFEHCSGFTTQEPNLGSYFGRMYQARYLSGIVAGLMTETNQLGYVAAIPIPEVIRIANAFYLGALSVNPDVTMQITALGSFFDPGLAREQANALIDDGADVVTMHEDTPSVPQAAQDRGVFSVSYQSDMSAFAPQSHITGVEWNWGPYYLNTLELLRDGGLDVRNVWSGFEDGTFVEPLIGLVNGTGGGDSGLINEALIASVRDSAKVTEILDALASARAALDASPVAGSDVVFGGALLDAETGATLPAEPSDGDLLGMDFPVAGVTGESFFSFFG